MTRSDDSPPAASETPPARRRTLPSGTAGIATADEVSIASTDGGTDNGSRRNDIDVIAHRGFAGENPENTVAAVEAAAGVRASDGATGGDASPTRRADLIEVDVVPTADGDIVVFHDDRLAGRAGGALGLTDTEGVVWETDTETVTNAEVLDSGETVPFLREIFEAIPADVGVNVELKNPGRTDLRFAEKLSKAELAERKAIWRPFVERVLSTLDEHDNEVLLSSFCEAPLATCREASSYPIAPILHGSVEDGLAIAREYDAEAVHPPLEMVRGTPFSGNTERTGVDLVETAHAEGRDVNVWTVKTWHQAEWLAAVGVDGLIADYSGLFDG